MELNKTNEISRNEDKKISISIMMPFLILTVQYLVLIFFHLLGTKNASIVQLISKLLVGIIYIYALPIVLKRSGKIFINTYLISFVIFAINYLIFEDNHIYLKELIFPFFFTCLPSFIYSISIKDFTVLKKVMKNISFIVLVVGIIIGLLIFSGRYSIGYYSMSISYYMLLPTIIYIDEMFQTLSLKSLFFTLSSFFIILSLGSRGAIVCCGVFILLKLIRLKLKPLYKKVALYLSLTTISALAYLYFNEIINFLNINIMKFGIKSRTLTLLLRNDITESSERNDIYNSVISEIIKKPFLGNGLAGDRQILSGRYSHNIFLEVMINFGVIVGGLLLIWGIYLIVKVLFTKDIEVYNITIIWISLGFVHFIVSSSYLTDFRFWIFIGLIGNIYLKKRKKTFNNKGFQLKVK